MEIFNIGLPEAFLIVVLIFVLLGADGTVETARKIGRFFRRVAKSPLWADITHTRQEVQDLTRQIMREAALQEDLQEWQELNQRVRQEFGQMNQHAPLPDGEKIEKPSAAEESSPQDKPFTES
jgi:Sec-independent protein translocase protein TatA